MKKHSYINKLALILKQHDTMKKLLLLLLTFFATSTLTFSQDEATTKDGKKVLLYDDGSWTFADSDPLYNVKPITVDKLEIPKLQPKETVVSHVGYSLSYNETHEQANWVAYELTKEETNQIWERTDKFLTDPKVKSGTANDKDYSGSGYDRGHLAPAGDMGWSTTAMAESFYYSNMSPQMPGFNRGIWKRLEELVRTWAVDNESVYVVTAPVLIAGLPTIGKNKVSVPNFFYKVILDYREPSIKGIGFIIPNTSSSEPLQMYAVSIDSVEALTGIDFFPSLPDDQENAIESNLNLKSWTWKNSKSTTGKEKGTTSVQCNGITKAGERCKNKTLSTSGFCYLHEGQTNGGATETETKTEKNSTSVQCKGTTKAGTQCKHMTLNASGYCYQHEGQTKSSSSESKTKTESSSGTNKSGQTTYTGPRGGTYHYSKSGKKVYDKKK